MKKVIIFFPDWKVTVRLHPRMDKDYKFIKKHFHGLDYDLQSSSVSLDDALSDTNVVCSVHSTLLVDAFNFECIPININSQNFVLVKNVDFKKLKTGIIINNYDTSFKEIQKLLNDDKLINFYRKNIRKRLKKIKNLDNFKKIVLKDLS